MFREDKDSIVIVEILSSYMLTTKRKMFCIKLNLPTICKIFMIFHRKIINKEK